MRPDILIARRHTSGGRAVTPWGPRFRVERAPSVEIMTDKHVSLNGDAGTSVSLLERALLKESAAWERLVSLYGPLIYAWCRRWGLQPGDAENVGQEVLLRLHRRLGEFRRERPGDTFRGWLFTIARNCYVDFVRRESRQPRARGDTDFQKFLEEIQDEVRDEDIACSSQDKLLLYHRAMDLIRNEFSDRDWSAFQKFAIEERPAGEVAVELGVSVNVIYLAKSRVLRRVREEFVDLIEV